MSVHKARSRSQRRPPSQRAYSDNKEKKTAATRKSRSTGNMFRSKKPSPNSSSASSSYDEFSEEAKNPKPGRIKLHSMTRGTIKTTNLLQGNLKANNAASYFIFPPRRSSPLRNILHRVGSFFRGSASCAMLKSKDLYH